MLCQFEGCSKEVFTMMYNEILHRSISSLAEAHGADSARQLLLIQLLLTVGIEEIEHLINHIQLPASPTNMSDGQVHFRTSLSTLKDSIYFLLRAALKRLTYHI
jgi:hypothetical protein